MDFCKLGLSVIEIEAQAISNLIHRIDQRFEKTCEILLQCQGRVVVTGMGKSGHIGHKIAATFASTGTPAFFMHPGEASHGDFGMITRKDVVVAISNSGFTYEIVTLIPLLKRLEIPLITFTGNNQSPLANAATINLDVSVAYEACPLGLAPTTSTTVALVMGDAIAITLLQARGFSVEDFALSHPGGTLGKRLLLRVDELAHAGNQLPVVHQDAKINEALIEVTSKKLGMTCVVNNDGFLVGIYTDGDIRRTLTQDVDIKSASIASVMTSNCKTIKEGLLASEALAIMQQYSITTLVIVTNENKPVGVVHLHDLLRIDVLR